MSSVYVVVVDAAGAVLVDEHMQRSTQQDKPTKHTFIIETSRHKNPARHVNLQQNNVDREVDVNGGVLYVHTYIVFVYFFFF